MNCPVCNRNLVNNISVCPACGTMVNDSVREEHTIKKSPIAKSASYKSNSSLTNDKLYMPAKLNLKPPQKSILTSPKVTIENIPPAEKPQISDARAEIKKTITDKLGVKPTSPTLVEFQHKESALPDWRLELKNAVRQKLHQANTSNEEEIFPSPRIINRTAGATALKPQYLEEFNEETALHENVKVQNALKRIQKSREKFLIVENEPVVEAFVETAIEDAPKRDFPYHIAARSEEVSELKTPEHTLTKPKLISSMPAENFKRDTNKLPPLPKPAKIATSFSRKVDIELIDDVPPMPKDVVPEKEIVSAKNEITISSQKVDDFIETDEIIEVENEDLASFSMRFNAGLFDLIIGAFASLVLLAPFILLGGSWFTTAGLFAFLATCSIVMFIYMTTAVGMFGRTFGMKMFSLEIIDIEENDYPTFHQAAVSAAVYLLSLGLGGSGFLTILFTDDQRAVHDIVSGTLMVKDCQEETA